MVSISRSWYSILIWLSPFSEIWDSVAMRAQWWAVGRESSRAAVGGKSFTVAFEQGFLSSWLGKGFRWGAWHAWRHSIFPSKSKAGRWGGDQLDQKRAALRDAGTWWDAGRPGKVAWRNQGVVRSVGWGVYVSTVLMGTSLTLSIFILFTAK